MPVDLKLDASTGDLVLTPAHDVALVSGIDLVSQRIRVRLKIQNGTWPLDPTGGELGSTLLSLTRVSIGEAVAQLPLLVNEALAPMDDIHVLDVTAQQDARNPSVVGFTVSYTVTDGQSESEPFTYTDTVEITQ